MCSYSNEEATRVLLHFSDCHFSVTDCLLEVLAVVISATYCILYTAEIKCERWKKRKVCIRCNYLNYLLAGAAASSKMSQ